MKKIIVLGFLLKFCVCWQIAHRLGNLHYQMSKDYGIEDYTELIIDEETNKTILINFGSSTANNFKALVIKNTVKNLDVSDMEENFSYLIDAFEILDFNGDIPIVSNLIIANRLDIIDRVLSSRNFSNVQTLQILPENFYSRPKSFEKVKFDFLRSFPNLQSLLTTDHNFSTFESKFEFNQNLRALNFSRNGIKHLANDTFSNVKMLENLNLEGNSLKQLDSNIFAANKNLEELNLSKNKLSELPEQIFWENAKIKKLWINDNQIAKLSSKLFSNLTELEEIDMHENQIEEIPQNLFLGNFKLMKVEFRKNRIKFIPREIFKCLTELEEVRFGYNQIKSLDAIFKDSSKLKLADFDRNEIFYISPEIFHKNTQLKECKKNDRCGFPNNPCTFTVADASDIKYCVSNWNKAIFWLGSGKSLDLY